MSYSQFYDVGIAVAAATILAVIFNMLKQPTILGYIVAGLLIGPVLGIVKDTAVLGNFSELGIALLLFIIGIELDIKLIKQLGLSSLSVGFLQVLTTAVISYFLAAAVGFSPLQAIYVGLIVTFSSTMVVIKLLSDKNELDSLHGELVLGILIVQDLLAVFAMALLGTISNFTPAAIGIVVGKGAVLILSAFAAGYILNKVLKYAVRSKELLFIFALSVCMVFAAWAAFLDYSLAIGAFMAGIILGNTQYSYEIAGKVKPLRDFFLTLFFVSLGMQITLSNSNGLLAKTAAAALMVVVLKPVITFLITKAFRFGNRTALLASVQLGQVSEFSLILVAAGISLGHISSEFFSIMAILTMLTFAITAYTIKFDNTIYAALSPFMKLFERLSAKEENLKSLPERLSSHVVVFGFYRMGGKVIRLLKQRKEEIVVVDYNPEKIRGLIMEGVNCICSDMANWEIDGLLSFKSAKAVVSTIRDKDNNLGLIGRVRESGSRAIVVVAAFSEEDALQLYKKGADYVVLPEQLGGEHIITNIVSRKKSELRKLSGSHIESIRKELAENKQ
ncbi:cation:proton antiporter [Candidatus Woesearchaeota archaeon]|nr:cation:proton antiporter [Candidatus Woesearchaeota archaeon]